MKDEMIHLVHLEENLHHSIEKVEVAKVIKNDEEEEDPPVHQGQDREAENEESLVLRVEEQLKAVTEGLIQFEEEIETQSLNLAQKAMIEVKAAQEGRNVHDQDLHRENIRKSDVEIQVNLF